MSRKRAFTLVGKRFACATVFGVLSFITFFSLQLHLAHSAPVARDARIGGDLQRTRFVADLSKPVKFRVFTLGDPYRVIIDLPEVNFQMPPRLGTKGRGLISAFRYGLFARGKSRIVIDVVEPVRVAKAFVRPAANGNPARLVVDLVMTTAAEFEKELHKRKTAAAREGDSAVESKQAALGGAGHAPARQTKAQTKPVIVIDPGHGGIDPGAISPNGVMEKDIVFKFAQKLKRLLDKRKRYEVHLTREIDMFIPLAERVDIARHHRADLFLSIHADSLPAKYADQVRGATVYTLSEEASDEEARLVAAKENRSDIIAGLDLPEKADDVSLILIDLMRRETKNFSVAFGRTILTNLKDEIALNKKPHRFADFRVLRAPDVPSVLLELGYLTNPRDEKLLTSHKWQSEVAERVARAIDAFFNKKEVRLPF